MRILIIGINHQIQPIKNFIHSTSGALEKFEQDQKDHFRELLRTKMSELVVELVGEETKHGDESVAERLCEGQSIRYVNIEMTPDERSRRNIPAGYQEEGSNVSAEEQQRGNREREEYMAQKIHTLAGSAGSALLICGRSHGVPIASALEALGHTVEIADLLDSGWYVEDWATHMRRL
jgi:hypothetical protein